MKSSVYILSIGILNSEVLDNKKIYHLRGMGFRQPEKAWDILLLLCRDIDIKGLFPHFLPCLIEGLSDSFDPDKGLNNFERFSARIDDKNHFYTLLTDQPIVINILIFLFSGSQFLTDVLLNEPEYLDWLIQDNTLHRTKSKDKLYQELKEMLNEAVSFDTGLKVLRRFKKREFLRIGLRDLMREADLVETINDLSNVADVSLQGAYEVCNTELISRYGTPIYRDIDGRQRECEFTVLGMGKLGGRELNFSSDIDLLYLYSSERGSTTWIKGRNQITNHEYYTKLSQMVTKAINEITSDGNVFRVDLGLRPEGKSGDIASSLRSYEIYYESWGETWERQMLLKARVVAGSEKLGMKFSDMTRSFVFRKYLDFSAINEIKNMKERINQGINAREVRGGNVKLGYGGIREIEFVIQVFQLIYGGRDEHIRERNSLKALYKIYDGGYLSCYDYSDLSNAYKFLRELENRIQISFGLQTHEIPEDMEERGVLSRKMGFSGNDIAVLSGSLISAYKGHTDRVRRVYDNLFYRDMLGEGQEYGAESFISIETIDGFNFEDRDRIQRNLQLMYDGPPFYHPTAKSKDLFRQIIPAILRLSSELPDPDMAINNLERFVSAGGSREVLYSLLLENKKFMEFLLSLFGNSEFLSNILIRQPDLIDGLLDIKGISVFKESDDMYGELSTMLRGVDSYEGILNEMRRFKRGEELRIGLRYILGEADLIRTMDDLSNLAGVYLRMAFEVSEAGLRGKYGLPGIEDQDGRIRDCGFSIIGMGKLGGYELDFGSDLDLVFVYSGDGNTSGIEFGDKGITNSISNHEYFSKMCGMIFNIAGGFTGSGFAYRIDTGLRPDGEKGTVVLPINGFRDYFSKRAETWERQALIKARPIAGDENLGREFIKIAYMFVYKEEFSPSVISEINLMRERMEYELTGRGDSQRDIKVGYGGIVDIEFITQLFQLKYGGRDHDLRTTGTLDALTQLNLKKLISRQDFQQLTESYIFLRRIENGLRIRNEQSVNVLPHSSAGLIRLAKMLGYSGDKKRTEGDKLLDDYRYHTGRVRGVYTRIFKSS